MNPGQWHWLRTTCTCWQKNVWGFTMPSRPPSTDHWPVHQPRPTSSGTGARPHTSFFQGPLLPAPSRCLADAAVCSCSLTCAAVAEHHPPLGRNWEQLGAWPRELMTEVFTEVLLEVSQSSSSSYPARRESADVPSSLPLALSLGLLSGVSFFAFLVTTIVALSSTPMFTVPGFLFALGLITTAGAVRDFFWFCLTATRTSSYGSARTSELFAWNDSTAFC
mmetsp:Transcript_28792/g.72458  ORF Transcript_28792/g.72458 Transcript_28792/m.72458 type:complete len:221 (-) Transcript_28792:273-935(-)